MKLEREKRGSSWKLDVTIAGRRYRESFTSKKRAEDFVVELREQARRRRRGLSRGSAPVLLEDLVKRQIAELRKRSSGGDKNAKRAIKILELFAGMFSPAAIVQDVRAAELRDFVDLMRKLSTKLGADSVNRYLAEISGMFKAAPSFFGALEDQDWRPPRFPWQRVSKRGRERIVTLEERELLLEALRFPGVQEYQNRKQQPTTIETRRDVADALEIGFNTAMRPGEVRKLTWAQVDFSAREAHLPETKSGEPGDVPLNQRAIEILRRRFEVRKTRWVFPNREGSGPRDEISKIVRPVAKALGLEYGQELPDGFTVHSQRHTATTEMLRAGHDMGTVRSITRHTKDAMTLHYSHASHASRRAAVESLARPAKAKGK